jgi:hypothetical protein
MREQIADMATQIRQKEQLAEKLKKVREQSTRELKPKEKLARERPPPLCRIRPPLLNLLILS